MHSGIDTKNAVSIAMILYHSHLNKYLKNKNIELCNFTFIKVELNKTDISCCGRATV